MEDASSPFFFLILTCGYYKPGPSWIKSNLQSKHKEVGNALSTYITKDLESYLYVNKRVDLILIDLAHWINKMWCERTNFAPKVFRPNSQYSRPIRFFFTITIQHHHRGPNHLEGNKSENWFSSKLFIILFILIILFRLLLLFLIISISVMFMIEIAVVNYYHNVRGLI